MTCITPFLLPNRLGFEPRGACKTWDISICVRDCAPGLANTPPLFHRHFRQADEDRKPFALQELSRRYERIAKSWRREEPGILHATSRFLDLAGARHFSRLSLEALEFFKLLFGQLLTLLLVRGMGSIETSSGRGRIAHALVVQPPGNTNRRHLPARGRGACIGSSGLVDLWRV